MRSFVAKFPVFVFVFVALLIQFSVILIARSMIPEGGLVHDSPLAHMVFRLRVFGPLVTVVAITWYLERKAGLVHLFSSFLHWRVPAKWYALAFSWKFVLSLLAVGITFFFFQENFRGWFANITLLSYLEVFPFIVGIAFVEESSWIRFSMTRLQMKYNAFWSAMIVGNCWGAWYLPMVFINEGVPPGYPILVFHLCVVGLAVILGWAYNSTRSGAVLLVMQIVSNTAFMVVPILPEFGFENGVFVIGSTVSVIAYSILFLLTSVMIVLICGTRDLAFKPRVRWDEHALHADAPREHIERRQAVPA